VSCRTADPADRICNGATDDAAGVAAVLSIAQAIADQPTRPRRSVIFALWDEEEDGLLGSQYFVFSHPLVPLDKITAYVNFDIQGANLLPSLRTTTFAVGAESGGSPLQNIVRAAAGRGALDTAILSTIFGQGRSDHATFQGAGVPSVFFTDATGPCYHTAQDEIGVVDFGKLDQQISTALDVTRQLAQTSTPPVYAFGTPPGHPAFIFPGPLATYWRRGGDLAARCNARSSTSAASPPPTRRRAPHRRRASPHRRRRAGRLRTDDVGTSSATPRTLVLNILPQGECSGFLAP
jgi:hypothetical protein